MNGMNALGADDELLNPSSARCEAVAQGVNLTAIASACFVGGAIISVSSSRMRLNQVS